MDDGKRYGMDVKVGDFLINLYDYKRPIYFFDLDVMDSVNEELNEGKSITEVGAWAEFILMTYGVRCTPWVYLREKYANSLIWEIRITDTEMILYIYQKEEEDGNK